MLNRIPGINLMSWKPQVWYHMMTANCKMVTIQWTCDNLSSLWVAIIHFMWLPKLNFNNDYFQCLECSNFRTFWVLTTDNAEVVRKLLQFKVDIAALSKTKLAEESYLDEVGSKGDLGLAKNYRGISLTSIAAKIYNALLRNRIEPQIDNILRKKQNGFWRNRSTTSQILTIRRILEGVRAKNLQATLLFVNFTKAFDSIHRGKMEQILLAYGLPKETVAAITILYRNTKVKVRSPDGDTEYFDIVAGVLQGDTLAPYLFLICLDYVLRTSIDKIRENGFELTKKKKKKQKVPHKNNYRHRLHRWHSVTGEYK